ncbi:MAG: heparinase II/III family protein [Cyclobacteriaceae bacterium]
MRHLVLAILLFLSTGALTQSIPDDRVVPVGELAGMLKNEVEEKLKAQNEITKQDLAMYLRQRFSERYFYDYRTFYDRLPHYNSRYRNSDAHETRALDHMGKYADSTQWVLPFNYLSGEPVNAYALRHLARQHKMVDIAFHYFNGDQDPEYIRYFERQMRSLNAALEADAYEKIKDGNGVYEVFRSGYRILNWLWIHNMFLNESEYSDEDQLVTIATLLQHGQHLYERNSQFRSGNHQTRGLSALAMLAILLRDFEGTDLWLERAMLRLSEHLDKEINADGFQFERSVHYHMSDINNYFYVYQLAKLNGIAVDRAWEEKLKGLFTTLVKIAYPDRSAPVLQDDTEIPWAETNDISGAMTLGYLLFEDPVFGYFASDKVDDRVYWFLSNEQVEMLEDINQQRPNYESLAFDETGYFIMREGWEVDDKMMIVSAGLDAKKPDHQHGDMLGIQAMANGHAILPNYQVRYSLDDFDLFKNSMVKNVALVDDELQGKEWTSNKGGSGFGKFRVLPDPEVIAWETNDDFDFFAGSHNGFEDVNVTYTRQVIFVKNEFWIVKDEFSADDAHTYKQVWQGHYTNQNGPDLLRATAPDATGHDILQLINTDAVTSDGARGKEWSIVSKTNEEDFSFLTVIYPYSGYSNRLDEGALEAVVKDWDINTSSWEAVGQNATTLSSNEMTFAFNMNRLESEELIIQSPKETDLFIKTEGRQISIQSIGSQAQTITVNVVGKDKESSRALEPGQIWLIDF